MNKLAIILAVGASALCATAATAAPLSNGMTIMPDSNVENVRMICNENGRCWRERGERRVIIRESYDGPRYRRGYDRGYGDGGVRVGVPGVSVGIGGGRY